MDDLKEKIMIEYELFKSIKLVEGKERIYNSAKVVALTRSIKDTILQMRFTDSELAILLQQPNLLGKIALWCDEGEYLSVKQIKGVINRFIQSKMDE